MRPGVKRDHAFLANECSTDLRAQSCGSPSAGTRAGLQATELTDLLLETTNRDEVVVADVTYVFDAQSEERLSAAGRHDELDFQRAGGKDLNHCAEISLP